MIIIENVITNERMELTENEMELLREILYNAALESQEAASRHPQDDNLRMSYIEKSNLYTTIEGGLI